MIPEPTTFASRKAVPSASAASFRAKENVTCARRALRPGQLVLPMSSRRSWSASLSSEEMGRLTKIEILLVSMR